MNKIGVLGGTFDPIHIGHLMLADQAALAFGLSKVLFVPSGRPPHKDTNKITPIVHRFEMVRLAIEGASANCENGAACNVGADSNGSGANCGGSLFEASEIECDMAETNFTYITLGKLRGIYGLDSELHYIIGSDVLYYITKFINFQEIFDSCVIVAATRPGEYLKQTELIVGELTRLYDARIVLMQFPEIAISSSLIREKISCGGSARFMTPDSVINYIMSNDLYTKPEETVIPGYWESIPEPAHASAAAAAADVDAYAEAAEAAEATTVIAEIPIAAKDTSSAVQCARRCSNKLIIRPGHDNSTGIKAIKRMMAERLSVKRYRHTIGVMEIAVGLAESLGVDRDIAAVAALLHDNMREAPLDSLIKVCIAGAVPVTEIELGAILVLHARAGAIEAGNFFDADSETKADILGAIASHTTGREDMGLLAKIIFLADAIEPGRKYATAREARRMLKSAGGGKINVERLDTTILYLLEKQIEHIEATGRALHPDTVLALDWLKKTRRPS